MTTVQEIMTRNPACSAQDEPLPDLARKMVEHDCGEIPIVESRQNPRPVGVVTDRDIACRTVARGANPLELRAGDIMSSPVVSVGPNDSLEDCCRIMEERQIRRAPVVDEQGQCCGIVSQADIARHAPADAIGAIVRDISRPAGAAAGMR